MRIECPACGARGTLRTGSGAHAVAVRCPRCGARIPTAPADERREARADRDDEDGGDDDADVSDADDDRDRGYVGARRTDGGGAGEEADEDDELELGVDLLDRDAGDRRSPRAARSSGPPPIPRRRPRADNPLGLDPLADRPRERRHRTGSDPDVEDGSAGHGGGPPRRRRRPPLDREDDGRPRRRRRAFRRPPRRFAVGDVVGKTFSVWARNILPFTMLSLIVFLPKLAFGVALALGELPFDIEGYEIDAVAFVMTMLLGPVVTGTVVFGVVEQLRGEPASMARCVSRGLQAVPSVLATGTVQAILVLGPLMAGGLIILTHDPTDGPGRLGLGLVIAVVGFIYMIWQSLRLWVAVPAAAVEGVSVLTALERSATLTSGERGSILGIAILIGIVTSAVGAMLTVPVALVYRGDAGAMALAAIIVEVLGFSLQAATAAVGYHELRSVREGFGAEDLAEVFD